MPKFAAGRIPKRKALRFRAEKSVGWVGKIYNIPFYPTIISTIVPLSILISTIIPMKWLLSHYYPTIISLSIPIIISILIYFDSRSKLSAELQLADAGDTCAAPFRSRRWSTWAHGARAHQRDGFGCYIRIYIVLYLYYIIFYLLYYICIIFVLYYIYILIYLYLYYTIYYIYIYIYIILYLYYIVLYYIILYI